MSWLKKQVEGAWRLVTHHPGEKRKSSELEHEHREVSRSRMPKQAGPNDSAHAYGALVPPLSPVGLEGRTNEQVEADALKLAWIEEHLLPSNLVKEAVERFMRRIASTTIHGALGSPQLVQELLQESSEEEFEELPTQPKKELRAQLDELRAQLDEHYSRFAEASQWEPSAQDSIEEEYEIARKELVRHWTGLVSSAVMLWGERGPVRFDQKLRPLPPADQKELWLELFSDTRDSLYAAIAVDRDDMVKITDSFASALREHTRAGKPVELPDRIDVVWEKNDLAALQRPAD